MSLKSSEIVKKLPKKLLVCLKRHIAVYFCGKIRLDEPLKSHPNGKEFCHVAQVPEQVRRVEEGLEPDVPQHHRLLRKVLRQEPDGG